MNETKGMYVYKLSRSEAGAQAQYKLAAAIQAHLLIIPDPLLLDAFLCEQRYRLNARAALL